MYILVLCYNMAFFAARSRKLVALGRLLLSERPNGLGYNVGMPTRSIATSDKKIGRRPSYVLKPIRPVYPYLSQRKNLKFPTGIHAPMRHRYFYVENSPKNEPKNESKEKTINKLLKCKKMADKNYMQGVMISSSIGIIIFGFVQNSMDPIFFTDSYQLFGTAFLILFISLMWHYFLFFLVTSFLLSLPLYCFGLLLSSTKY